MIALAIIPARAGSKRLPGKNLMEIGGRSLVQIAVETAIEAGVFTWVAVSTDSVEISEHIGKRCPRAEIFMRPPSLAQDDTPMMPVVRSIHRLYGGGVDSVMLLQPTSPLRLAADVSMALSLMGQGADGVISVVRSSMQEAYSLGHANRLRPLPLSEPMAGHIYVPNGAIYCLRGSLVPETDWWQAPVMYGYEMPLSRSIDIDTLADLEDARRIAGA